MFCMDLIKLVSDINVLKFFRPTNVSFGEYAPFSNNDIRNTFKVGNIINTKNKITAGAMHTAKNRFVLWLFHTFTFLSNKPYYLKFGGQKFCPPTHFTTIALRQTKNSYFKFARIWSLAEIIPSIHACSSISPDTNEFTGSKNTVRTSTPGIASNAAKLPIAAFAPLS